MSNPSGQCTYSLHFLRALKLSAHFSSFLLRKFALGDVTCHTYHTYEFAIFIKTWAHNLLDRDRLAVFGDIIEFFSQWLSCGYHLLGIHVHYSGLQILFSMEYPNAFPAHHLFRFITQKSLATLVPIENESHLVSCYDGFISSIIHDTLQELGSFLQRLLFLRNIF